MKSKSIFGVTALLTSLLMAGTVRAQTLTYDSNTHQDFATPQMAVGAGRTLIAGWTDLQGGVYSVSGGSLNGTSRDTLGYLHNLALRPAGEDAATPNVEGTIAVPTRMPSPGTANGLVLRYQPGGTFYLFQVSPDSLYAYKVIGGNVVTRLGVVPISPNTANAYSLTASAVNAGGGVQLGVSALDARTGKIICTLSLTDASSPIAQAGRVGVDSWVANGATGTMTASYSRVAFYQLEAVPPAASAFPKIGFIGDSITSGYNQVGNTITPGTNDVAALTVQKLTATGGGALTDYGIAWSAYDQGSSGSSTADWLPGGPSSLDTRAKNALSAAFGKPDPATNPVWVLLMLGTNDVRSDHLFTAAQHQKNMQAIVENLVAGGYNVVINRAPSFVTPTSFNGVTWSAAALTLLRSYLRGEQTVAASFATRAPGRVSLGDTSAFDYFATRPALFQEYGVYGGLHPNGTGGTDALATFWAQAFPRR